MDYRLLTHMNFENKRILITAGPTWIAIDDVRVISNIATGETGILLAEKLSRLGAKVTLLLGSAQPPGLKHGIKLIPFRYYSELKSLIEKELKPRNFDIIIHNAAVSDFGTSRIKGKLASGKPVILKLEPLPKLTSLIRRLNKKALLVIFKFAPALSNKALLNRAIEAMEKSGADLAVANKLKPYRAFIINRHGSIIRAGSRAELALKLIRVINLIN